MDASNKAPTRNNNKGPLVLAILSAVAALALTLAEVIGIKFYNWSPNIAVVLGVVALAYAAFESFRKWKAAGVDRVRMPKPPVS
jgi:hypothetical protein